MTKTIALLALLTLGANAWAETVTYNFTGEIVNSSAAPVPNVEIGTTFSGSFTYEDGLPSSGGNAHVSFYVPARIHLDFTSTTNMQSSLIISNARIRVDNDNSCDQFAIEAGDLFGTAFTFNGSLMNQLRIIFIDCSATVFNGTSLPSTLFLDSFSVRELGLVQSISPSIGSAGRIFTLVPPISDEDHDGVLDPDDNCPSTANPDQTDTDLDGVGDVCDPDDDGDDIADGSDNCPLVANAGQPDSDGDGLGDACDSDLDDDGFANELDNCPAASNPDQTDTDQDGLGDECDTDDDGDGLFDANDNCPAVQNPGQEDLDGDGIGDFCDSDLDGDGVENQADNCPIDANVGQDDTDGDGLGDVCDPDADNDSVSNEADNCPLIANLNQSDSDNDGAGDACDSDLDGDGVANGADNCPIVANSAQTDFDGDGQGDACDGDADGDGVANGTDECAATPLGTVTDPAHGCSITQLCPCEGPRGTVMPWRNHGKYTSCVAHAAGDFADQGLISLTAKDELVSAAAQSSCGQ